MWKIDLLPDAFACMLENCINIKWYMIALLSLMIKAFKLKIHYAKAWSTKIVYEHVFEIKIQRKRKIILKTKLNFKGFYDISHHCASEMKYWLTWSAWRENCWNKLSQSMCGVFWKKNLSSHSIVWALVQISTDFVKLTNVAPINA